MKICFLMVSHWTGTLGGAETQVRYIMNHLNQNTGHEISMVCRHSGTTIENGMPIYTTRSIKPFQRYFKSADYFSVRRLLRLIGPDVVYTRVSSPFVAFAAEYCRARNRPLIYHVAHMEDVVPASFRSARTIPRLLERPLYEWGLRRADAIIAQARYQKDLLKQHYGLDCAAVIPNVHPVPESQVSSGGVKTVVWVGSLKSVKQPQLFIELARRLSDMKELEFVMVGMLQEPKYQWVADIGAEIPRFRFLGSLPIEEVNSLLSGAQLLVNTSQIAGEGFPNTFIQAWLRHTPVVSLEVDPDGILESELIGTSAGGSFERLEREVRDITANTDRWRRLANNAREYAVRNHGMNNVTRILELMDRFHEIHRDPTLK